MTKTNKITPWGIVYYYNQEEFSFTLHFYDDDPITAYLANVKVAEEHRRKGFGNKILKLANKEAKELGAKNIMLQVERKEWMHDWYARHDYHDNYRSNSKTVWMTHAI